MSGLMTVLALVSLVCGLVFLAGAITGLLRFSDPLQRMHAATKAGAAGAMFTVLGAMFALQDATATVIGLLAILFLLITVPVAGHVLGRGIYISGAGFEGQVDRDELQGILERHATQDAVNKVGDDSQYGKSSA